jgi:two-component system NtrC family sensor kinase
MADLRGPASSEGRSALSRQRAEMKLAEERLAARTRELDLIQTLGRRAAEARTARELFHATISALQLGEEIDLAMVAHRRESGAEILAWLSRPVEERCLDRLAGRAGGMLGWSPEQIPAAREVRLDTFDEERGRRADFREEDLVVLPILRGESAVACLLVLPLLEAGEEHLRLLYSAANHLCLHLDRILTVREAEEDRFRSILDSMPQAVLLIDGELRVVQSNQSAGRIFEQLQLPISGSLEDVIEKLGVAGPVERVRNGEASFAEEEVWVGSEWVLSVTFSPMAGGGSEGRGLVMVVSDVTERRRLQQQLAQSEKMSSLGQMISGVAHELNNPLASILGYSQLLGTRSADPKTSERLEILKREGQRCQKIVQNLLSFARRRESERKKISLNEVVKSVLALMGYQLKVDGIELRSELSSELPSIIGDTHELQQVLVNLLTNARQAMRQGGGGGEIVLRTWPLEEGGARLEVRDSGPGIPEEIRSKIFDPFFTTKPEGSGTGLGLSLVYDIVTSHGGTIEAIPCEECGAAFDITLPAAPESAADASRPGTAARPAPPRSGRILVVEDEQALGGMICEILEEDGHDATTVEDGRQALELIGREEFDLIISDIKMPGMGGVALYEEIQRTRSDLAARFLLTTGDTVSAGSDRFAERNRLPVLRKPFDLDALRRTVRTRLAAAGERKA